MPKRSKKSNLLEYVLVILALMILLDISSQTPQPIACTQEAMVCPDGTIVGRNGQDCSFAPCPSCKCPNGYVQEGGTCNPSCYYSEPRCMQPSVQCEQITSCLSDADCVPAQCCHPTTCMNKAFKGVCNLACTLSCETPLDCGQANCGCVNNVCSVIPA
jgi:hypothetical protein